MAIIRTERRSAWLAVSLAASLSAAGCGAKTSFTGSEATRTVESGDATVGTPGVAGTDSKAPSGPASPAAPSGPGDVSQFPTGPTAEPPPPPPPKVEFGLLVNDLNCTFCHLEVHGTIGSVGDVPPLRSDSHGVVYGDWLVAGQFHATDGLTGQDGGLVVSGTLTQGYANAGHELPVDQNGAPALPQLDFSNLASAMQGSVLSLPAGPAYPTAIEKVYNGNLVLIGTQAHPIQLNRDVLVDGDLIIAGVYQGVGTLYATGNIYIPANLTALSKAAFPYPDPVKGDSTAADKQAAADIAAKKDALGLASKENIFVGDLENYDDDTLPPLSTPGADGQRYSTLYDQGVGAGTDPLMDRDNNGVTNVYSWYPEASYDKLYQAVPPCWTATNPNRFVPSFVPGSRAVNEIDAYLYAEKIIGGVARATNWTINGGMIAQTMHIVSGAGSDSVAANAACAPSRINFDYRMRNGLQILEALAPFFPHVAQ